MASEYRALWAAAGCPGINLGVKMLTFYPQAPPGGWFGWGRHFWYQGSTQTVAGTQVASQSATQNGDGPTAVWVPLHPFNAGGWW